MKIFMNFGYKVYIKLKMIVKIENDKLEVKRVTQLKAIHTVTSFYFSMLYLSWNNVASLV